MNLEEWFDRNDTRVVRAFFATVLTSGAFIIVKLLWWRDLLLVLSLVAALAAVFAAFYFLLPGPKNSSAE